MNLHFTVIPGIILRTLKDMYQSLIILNENYDSEIVLIRKTEKIQFFLNNCLIGAISLTHLQNVERKFIALRITFSLII